MRAVSPYGSWPSIVTPELLVEQAVGLSQIEVAAGRVMWNEARPTEGGRQVLMSASLDAGAEPAAAELLGPEFSVRTLVHEYGGRCYAVHGSTVVFSNAADQRLWWMGTGGPPVPLTDEGDQPRTLRYADPVISPNGAWLVCVRERHSSDTVINDVVALALPADGASAAAPGAAIVLASGHDFYAAPRLSPDGTRLAWLSWDHPAMPWDRTELWAAEFGDATGRAQVGPAHRVAGGDESVTQPRWNPDGRLHYIADRSGWWNLYDETGAALAPLDAEFSGPDWAFGQSSYVFLPDGRLVASWAGAGGERLGLVHDGTVTPIDLPFTSFGDLRPLPGAIVAVVGSPTEPPAVVYIGVDDARVTLLRRSRLGMDPAWVSVPEAITFPSSGGRQAHALFYPPFNPDFSGPVDERPPLVVMSHGGPTSQASAVLNPRVQFWTSRGIAVVDVDYGGSSGYGREYRQALQGAWGIVDVDDCVAAADALATAGRVDGRRMVIRGGSAGGFTTLAALAFRDTFVAGASHYGVADLELLARDTHKFESRYLDGLIGPWPDAAALYQERSPIHHVELITRPLILFQGLEDRVVPPEQSELMAGALRRRGVPVAYLTFDGEQHGFRRAETIVRVTGAELAFYGRVLGFTPADQVAPFLIDNEEALPPRAA